MQLLLQYFDTLEELNEEGGDVSLYLSIDPKVVKELKERITLGHVRDEKIDGIKQKRPLSTKALPSSTTPPSAPSTSSSSPRGSRSDSKSTKMKPKQLNKLPPPARRPSQQNMDTTEPTIKPSSNLV